MVRVALEAGAVMVTLFNVLANVTAPVMLARPPTHNAFAIPTPPAVIIVPVETLVESVVPLNVVPTPRIVFAPEAFPMLRAVEAPPNALMVVAVVLNTANVVEVVVTPVMNGIAAVAVCVPSLRRQVLSPVAISVRVLLFVVLEITVPVTTGLPETRLNVPLENGIIAVLVEMNRL